MTTIPGEAIVGIEVVKDDDGLWSVTYLRASATRSPAVGIEYVCRRGGSLGEAIDKATRHANLMGLSFDPFKDFEIAGYVIHTSSGIWSEIFASEVEANITYRAIAYKFRDMALEALWREKA